MKKPYYLLILLLVALSCQSHYQGKEIIAIPVYGQSLALGEEAVRVTDFDSLVIVGNDRIVTENLDTKFGFFSENELKQWGKKLVKYDKRSFELSLYGMSEYITQHTDNQNLILCIFPGGKGASNIDLMSKGTKPYNKFLKEIAKACKKAKRDRSSFSVPMICFMQGETDVTHNYNKENYKDLLLKLRKDLSDDIQAITHQDDEVIFICYQTNSLSLSKDFDSDSFNCESTIIPQSQLEIIRDCTLFAASGPTYPYSVVKGRVHLDGVSQKRLGSLAGLTVVRLLNGESSNGLIPSAIEKIGPTSIAIRFDVKYPPLCFDTSSVKMADNYGFSVINSLNENIIESANIEGNSIIIHCKSDVSNSMVRYAVNGEYNKSGNIDGPRGNLRDSQGDIYQTTIGGEVYPLHNWCYQFNEPVR